MQSRAPGRSVAEVVSCDAVTHFPAVQRRPGAADGDDAGLTQPTRGPPSAEDAPARSSPRTSTATAMMSSASCVAASENALMEPADPTTPGIVQDNLGDPLVVRNVAVARTERRRASDDARPNPETLGFRASLLAAASEPQRSTFAAGFAQAIRRRSTTKPQARTPRQGPLPSSGSCAFCGAPIRDGGQAQLCSMCVLELQEDMESPDSSADGVSYNSEEHSDAS